MALHSTDVDHATIQQFGLLAIWAKLGSIKELRAALVSAATMGRGE